MTVYLLSEHTASERHPKGVTFDDLPTANDAARKRAAELGYTALDDNGGDTDGVVYSDPAITRFVGVYAQQG